MEMLEGGTMGTRGITVEVGIIRFPMEMHGGTMERARIGPLIGIKVPTQHGIKAAKVCGVAMGMEVG